MTERIPSDFPCFLFVIMRAEILILFQTKICSVNDMHKKYTK
ncbi:MAG: hypothetical protein K0R50_3975 [Eubacterium sp.]|nr:hypothetical protein [Eubacterium sp.]